MDEKKSDGNRYSFSRFFITLTRAFTLEKKVEQQKQIEKTLKEQQHGWRWKMKLIKKVMLMCVLSFLVGCIANRSTSCGGWLPIYLDQQDVSVISSNLAREILKHNKQGERLCGGEYG